MNFSLVAEQASKVSLACECEVQATIPITISSNRISIDGQSMSISDLSEDFGDVKPGTTQSLSKMKFKCGPLYLSSYDFAVLIEAFRCLINAHIDTHAPVVTESTLCDKSDYDAVWFCNSCLVTSPAKGRIFYVPVNKIKSTLKGETEFVYNTLRKEKVMLSMRGHSLSIDALNSEHIVSVPYSEFTRTHYAASFKSYSIPSTTLSGEWDTESLFGSMVQEQLQADREENAIMKYRVNQGQSRIKTRDDLCFDLNNPLARENTKGALCYTSNGSVSMAVNVRNGMIIYKPWYTDSHHLAGTDLKADTGDEKLEYFDVTNFCMEISRFANTVVNRPVSTSQLDREFIENLKDYFYSIKLSRLPYNGCFGSVVIPESVLRNLLSDNSTDFYTLVPVGVIGNVIVTLCEDGSLSLSPHFNDLKNEYFYDISSLLLGGRSV